ncbi:cell division protein SepF [soil metagenome]
MAGAMRKVGEYLGLVEQAEFDEEFETVEPQPTTAAPAVSQRASVARLEDRRPTPTVAPAQSELQLARIESVTPRTYNDARTVGEHFRSGVPVIMNLSEIAEGDAKRLVDFAAGLVFASHGSINRVTSKVFLLSPEHVAVTDEDKQRIAAGGFYNQS